MSSLYILVVITAKPAPNSKITILSFLLINYVNYIYYNFKINLVIFSKKFVKLFDYSLILEGLK